MNYMNYMNKMTTVDGVPWYGRRCKPKSIGIDIETFSDVDLSACGVYRYVEGDFHILLFAYHFDDDEVEIIDLASGELLPDAVLAAIDDPEIIKHAWNAQFERICIGHYLGHTLDPSAWHCTMVHAASLGLPLSLKKAAEAMGNKEQKDTAGEALIRYFSIPCKPTKSNGGRRRNLPEHNPAKWEQFKLYCCQDVRTERDIRSHLDRFPMQPREWDHYHLDQRINDRGVRIDDALVVQAIRCNDAFAAECTERAKRLTGLSNPNSVIQLKAWLSDRGVRMNSLGKEDVEKMLENHDLDPRVRAVLECRQLMSMSSVKKYEAAERYICADGRAHGLFQFNGAPRTNRFSGRGIQLQNLRRNSISTLAEARRLVRNGEFETMELVYGNTPDVLSQLTRTMLIPREDCEFIIADFSAIEARLLAWLADEQWRIDAFDRGEDIYCASATHMFGVPVVKHGLNGELRQRGKIAELACGYGGSIGALKAMGATDMGLTEEELGKLVTDWREANPNIVKFWWDVDEAATKAADKMESSTVGKLKFSCNRNSLWIELPSGRKLAYPNPKLETNKYGKKSLAINGLTTANKWGRVDTYGPKIVENCTQAIARDLLCEAMHRLEKTGFDIVAHVHDEVILEVPLGLASVKQVCDIMCESPIWCRGINLTASGYKAEWYYKD